MRGNAKEWAAVLNATQANEPEPWAFTVYIDDLPPDDWPERPAILVIIAERYYPKTGGHYRHYSRMELAHAEEIDPGKLAAHLTMRARLAAKRSPAPWAVDAESPDA